ncbi:hypothetical protein BSKO_03020 [Bryopsis sp. KO-2023]|nr:hypothetical protein BSKO_03020 [Bryopsis sp. KO-2023]
MASLMSRNFSHKRPRSTRTGRPVPAGSRHLRRRRRPGRLHSKSVTFATSKDVADNAVKSNSDRFYLNLTGFPFPLAPLFERETIRYEVEPDRIWTFEQPQGFEVTTTNVRMTVIKLESGGLWVHAPIAPTKECVRLIQELNAPVEHIILATYAYEHKIFVGPFSRKFPEAKVYVAPKQWSWPINLPLQFFGIFPQGVLKDMDSEVPWADEIEQKLFTPPPVGLGSIVECAFFHKSTGTLLLTDAVVCVGEMAPDVVPVENLLDQADDAEFLPDSKPSKKGVRPPDSPEARRKGWMRNVLRVLYVKSSDLLNPEQSFEAVVGKLIVSPIIRPLYFGHTPEIPKIAYFGPQPKPYFGLILWDLFLHQIKSIVLSQHNIYCI